MDYILLILHIWIYDSVFGYSPNHGGFKIWIVCLKNHTWNSLSSILFWHPLKLQFINMTSVTAHCCKAHNKHLSRNKIFSIPTTALIISYLCFCQLLSVSLRLIWSGLQTCAFIAVLVPVCPLSKSFPIRDSWFAGGYSCCWDLFPCQIQLDFYSFYSLFLFSPERGSFPPVKIHKLFHLDH